MSPPCPAFPVRNLPALAQLGADGKVRKTQDGGRIDLARDCALFGLVQYECIVQQPELANSPVQCWPVQRWFRRCQDKKGSFTVETTAWEGTAVAAAAPSEVEAPDKHGVQSSTTAASAAPKT